MNNKLVEFKFDDLVVNDSAEFIVEITSEMVMEFANLSGDHNPLHVDKTYAKETELGQTIVHGLLTASFFSRLIGMHLPGKYALFLSQTLRFKTPIYIGQKVTVRGKITQKVEALKTVKINTEILDENKVVVLIDGEAMVKLLK
ncbi:MaoC family dehydratase [Patescibacteria group bacterium]|nr:MaoC family dehydratase [Patescibacteria group bacterium]